MLTAIEETIDSDGRLKLHITRPVKGWVTKNRSLAKATPGSDTEVDTPVEGNTDGMSEFELLSLIEDSMEVDKRSRDVEWRQNKTHRESKTDETFKKLTGASTLRDLGGRLKKMGPNQLNLCITETSRNLVTLYSRKTFLAFLLSFIQKKVGLILVNI